MNPFRTALLSACLALSVPTVGRAQLFGHFGGYQPYWNGYSSPIVGAAFVPVSYPVMPMMMPMASAWIAPRPHVIPPSTYQFVSWGIQCLPAPTGETCPTSSRVPILNPNAREDELILFQIIRIQGWRRGYAIYVQAMRHLNGLVTTFVTATSTDAVPPGSTLQSTQATIHLGMTAILEDLTATAIH